MQHETHQPKQKASLLTMASLNEGASVEEWHKSKEFLELVRNFHSDHARFPKDEFKEAKPRHQSIIEELRVELSKQGIVSRIEYTGSAYEGIKVRGTDLEFDCMLVMRGGEFLEKQAVHPGYVKLKPSPGKQADFVKMLDSRGNLTPEKVKSRFYGYIQKCINDSAVLKSAVILRMHGPAIQIDVCKGNGDFWYSVDLVPAYEVRGLADKELYVAKPLKGQEESWRRSFSLQEKNLLSNLDGRDNGVRKECVRMLKVIRDREPGLAKLNSYILKTVLFHVNKDAGLNWKPEKLGERLVDLMRKLAAFLEGGNLPHSFLPQINLIADMTRIVRKNMADRINRILKSQNEFKKFLI